MDRVVDKIRVTLLGDYRIGRDNGSPPIAIKSKKGRALFAFLALHLDRPVSRSRIAALLWQDQPEITGRQSLRQILTELRNEIGPLFDHGVSKDNIQLNSRDFSVDAVEFVRFSRNPSGYEAAVSLYAGDLTTDFDVKSSDFEDWLLAERRKLHNQAIEIFDAHIKVLTDRGEQDRALALSERLLAIDPLRESTHRLLLKLDATVNGRASAIARAETLKVMLSGQLGVSPERATIEVIESITNAKDSPQSRSTVRPNASAVTSAPARRSQMITGYLLAASLFAAIAGAFWYFVFSSSAPESQTAATQPSARKDKLVQNADTAYSIAVLPFTVRAASDDLKRFANALEEDVIDSLSRAPRFLVISRQTTRAYRNTDRDAREIGKELNVEFLLSGNIDLDGDKLVIRAQLIETSSGLLTWSDRLVYTREANHEAFQEIVLAVARELQIQVIFSEATKRARLERDTPTYGDLVQRAVVASMQSFTRLEAAEEALQLFEQAAAINPKHAAARIGIASILIRRTAELRSPDRAKDIERAEALLLGVVKDLPDTSSAHFFLGIVRKQQGRNAESVAQFEKAIRLNPSNAHAYAQLGHSFIFLGRPEETAPYIAKAIRLSPRDPTISSWYFFAGQADLHLRRYDDAIRWFERAIEAYPDTGRVYIHLSAAHMLRGDKNAAAKAAKKALQRLPSFKADNFGNLTGDADEKYLVERKRITAALKEAIELARNMP